MPHTTGNIPSPTNNKDKENGTATVERTTSSIRRDLTGVRPIRSITQTKSIRPTSNK